MREESLTLQPRDVLLAEQRREPRVLAVALLAAAPERVAADVYHRVEAGERAAAAALLRGVGRGPHFVARGAGDGVHERLVPRLREGERLREHAEEAAQALAGAERRDAEPRDLPARLEHLRRLLRHRQLAQQVLDARADRQRVVAVVPARRPAGLLAARRRLRVGGERAERRDQDGRQEHAAYTAPRVARQHHAIAPRRSLTRAGSTAHEAVAWRQRLRGPQMCGIRSAALRGLPQQPSQRVLCCCSAFRPTFRLPTTERDDDRAR